jgi:putative oxidoreductase
MRVRDVIGTTAPCATVFVRVIVGWVFLSEGILKFTMPKELGAGRFAGIGIPSPEIMGPFVGVVEIVCGGLLILGLLTRLAAIPLLIDISVAIVSTKVPILLGHGFWLFSAAKQPPGFWSMMHESRTDLAMWMGLVFLLIVGAGSASVDAMMTRETNKR